MRFSCILVSSNPLSCIVCLFVTAYGISLLGGKAHPNIMDYDTKPQYTIVVSCTDDLGLTTEKTIYLNVVRNEPPVINVLPSKYAVQ